MAAENQIADDEVLLRHIPGGPSYQQPPGPRITSANFVLRQEESGVSVTRAAITPSASLMVIVGGDLASGSRIAAARAGDIRAIGLSIVPSPTDDDPGHAEIRSDAADLNTRAIRREIAQLFRFVPAI